MKQNKYHLYRWTKAVLFFQLCQIRCPTLKRGAGETTKNYLVVTWNSPSTSIRTKNSIHIVKQTEIYLQEYNHTVVSFECFEWTVIPLWVTGYYCNLTDNNLKKQPGFWMVKNSFTSFDKSTKKTSAAAEFCCEHNVPRRMIWQASIDRFLQLLWNGLFEIISSNYKDKQFYHLTIRFWTHISLAHHSHWTMFPSYPEIERHQPTPSEERQISHLFPKYRVQRLCVLVPQFHTHSLPSSLDQLKSSQAKTSCTHINCGLFREERQASKLRRRDDANIAVQSLFLNRLIVLPPADRTHFKTDLKRRRNF